MLVPAVFVVGCLVTFVRCPSVVLHPSFWAEDGTSWFHDAYTDGPIRSLPETHAGYLQVFPRLVADLGLYLPLRLVPLLFVLVAVAVQALPAAVVVSRRFATVVPDYRVRLLLAAIYLVVPNSAEVNANLTDAQWHLALVAVLVVLAAPARGTWRIFDLVVVVLSGLTGPFDLSLAVIVVLVYLYRRQRWTLVLGAMVLVTGALEVASLMTSVRPRFGPLGATLPRLAEILGGRLVANTLLGTSTTGSVAFESHLLLYSSLFVVLGASVVVLAVWRGPIELKMFNLYTGLVLAGSLWSPVIAPIGSQWQVLTGELGLRYWLLPSLAVLADLVWLAGQFTSARRWAAPAGLLCLVGLIALAAFGIREDFRYPAVGAPSWPAQVQRFDSLSPGQPFTFNIRPPGWSLTLTRK